SEGDGGEDERREERETDDGGDEHTTSRELIRGFAEHWGSFRWGVGWTRHRCPRVPGGRAQALIASSAEARAERTASAKAMVSASTRSNISQSESLSWAARSAAL